MPLLRNSALQNHPILTRLPKTDHEWKRFTQSLDSQSVVAAAISGGIESVDSLPSLPDNDYPSGSVVFLTSDNKLYRNTDGSTWSKEVDGNDIEANSILTNAIAAGAITAAEIDVDELSAINADMGSITAGTITLDSSGHIKSGQTNYDTGTGFWLGIDSSTPKFSIGDSSGDSLKWNGSTLSILGDVQFNQSNSFTPNWSGFSTNPSLDLNYAVLGNIAIIWSGINAGESNSNEWSLDNLPNDITPNTSQRINFLGLSNGVQVFSTAIILSTGAMTFEKYTTSNADGVGDTHLTPSSTAWATSGTKGIQNMTLVYFLV